jgi:hypothetical protein
MLSTNVQKAMETLSSRIDTNAGLNSPRDRATAVGALSELRSAGEPFEPEDIAAWASLHDWTPKGVARIRTLANDILVGKPAGARG